MVLEVVKPLLLKFFEHLGVPVFYADTEAKMYAVRCYFNKAIKQLLAMTSMLIVKAADEASRYHF